MGVPIEIEASDGEIPLTLQWRGGRDFVAAGIHDWDEWVALAHKIVSMDQQMRSESRMAIADLLAPQRGV